MMYISFSLPFFRETALLWDNTESTISYKQRVGMVIAHEFTHMWFGNLVTMDWWSYTWLNEGFARYYQYVVTNEVSFNVDELIDISLLLRIFASYINIFRHYSIATTFSAYKHILVNKICS